MDKNQLLHAAAEQGNAEAQFELGDAYRDGDGVSANDVEAARWWRKAAEQGHKQAQYQLSLAYCNYGSECLPKDYVQAHMWFTLGCESVFEPPTADQQRKNLEQYMTSAQIAEAQRLAREWKQAKSQATKMSGKDTLKLTEPKINKFSLLLLLIASGAATLSTFSLLVGVRILVTLLQRWGQEPVAHGTILGLFSVWVVLVGGLLAIALKALPNYKLNSLPYFIFGALNLITGLFERETEIIWAGLITFIFGVFVRNISWNADEYPREVNIRWAWLRAVEWIGWPLFVTQPLIPVFLYFYPWYWVLAAVTVITFFWRVFICPKFISKELAAFGQQFVLLKFITCPVMAYILWQRGDMIVAALALFWPLIGTFTIAPLLAIIHGLTGTARTLDIGPVQNRLLRALGYDRKDSWE